MLRVHCVLLAIFASAAYGQTAPVETASAPVASAPAAVRVPADYSTPVAAAKSLVRASAAKDLAGVREALTVPAEQGGDVDALLETMASSWKLQEMAKKHFGGAGEKTFASGGPSEAEQLKLLDDAKVDVKGETATLTLPAAEGETARTVQLKKTPDGWKTDAAELYGLGTDAGKARVAQAKKVTAIAQDVVKAIDGGKMMSATEAYQVFWTRCQALVAATGPASGAAKP